MRSDIFAHFSKGNLLDRSELSYTSGIFLLVIYSHSLLPSVKIHLVSAPWKLSKIRLVALRGAGEMSEHTLEGGASRARGTSANDFRVNWLVCAEAHRQAICFF